MIIRYFIVMIILSPLFFMGNVMSDENQQADNEILRGREFTITWFFQYQKNGEKRYVHNLNLTNIGDTVLESQNWLYTSILYTE